MTIITPEIRDAIEQAGNLPPTVLDPQTNTKYVILRADLYESLRPLLDQTDEISGDEMMHHMWEVMKDDWTDPKMDVYDSEEYA